VGLPSKSVALALYVIIQLPLATSKCSSTTVG
jgi:hypothetical protein